MVHNHTVQHSSKIHITIQTVLKPGTTKMPVILARVTHVTTRGDLKFANMIKVAARL